MSKGQPINRTDLEKKLISLTHEWIKDAGLDIRDIETFVTNQVTLAIDAYVSGIIGEDIDLSSKYEDMEEDGGIITTIDDEESDNMTGERLAHLANFVADKTSNEIRADMRKKAGYQSRWNHISAIVVCI